MSDYLIIDWVSSGHRIDYLNEIEKFLVKNNKKAILFFPKTKLKKYKNIKKIFFRSNYNFTGSVYDKIILKFFLLKKIKKYIREDTKIIFLHLDSTLLVLLLFKIFYLFKSSNISGILMRPELHYLKYFNIKIKLNTYIKFVLKDLLIKYLLKLKVKILSLDYKYCEYKKKRVSYIEDFIPIDKTSKSLPQYIPKDWIRSKNRILAFGFMDDKRKGMNELIECLHKLNMNKTSILIVGKIEKKLLKKLNLAKKKYFNLNIINRYVCLEDLSKIIYNSDKIIATYINFSGVSNVFNWAKCFSKTIIVSNYGMMGFEAKKYNKSIIINKINSYNLSKSIEKNNYKRNLKKKFTINNVAKNNFSEKLLNH